MDRAKRTAAGNRSIDPDERYYALYRVGELVDAQTIDEWRIVVSVVYRYDGKYHFIKRHWRNDYWFDLPDKDRVETIQQYHKERIRRKLWAGEVVGLQKLTWRLFRLTDLRAFYKVKAELEHDTDIYEDLKETEQGDSQ